MVAHNGSDMQEELGGWIIYSDEHSSLSFEEWLKKYRPSNPAHSGSPWIAVSARPKDARKFRNEDALGELTVEREAARLAEELAQKIQAIEADDTIPVRGSKAKGPSKKARRDELYPVAAAALEKLAKDNGCTSGKWLFFPALANVDAVWEKIARSVIETDGALRGKVYTAKVATYQPGSEEESFVICVYLEDSWDHDSVGEVYRILVRDLGLVSTSYKADIYTVAGLDSKHPSKMRSTLYGKSDFMTQAEIDAAFEARRPKEAVPIKKKAAGTGFIDSDSDGSATEASDDESSSKKKASGKSAGKPPTKKAKK